MCFSRLPPAVSSPRKVTSFSELVEHQKTKKHEIEQNPRRKMRAIRLTHSCSTFNFRKQSKYEKDVMGKYVDICGWSHVGRGGKHSPNISGIGWGVKEGGVGRWVGGV